MQNFRSEAFGSIFTCCRHTLGKQTWGRVLAALGEPALPQTFAERLQTLKKQLDLPDFIDDLARIEWTRHQTPDEVRNIDTPTDSLRVNPTLTLLPVSWKNLSALIETDRPRSSSPPEAANMHVMIWRHGKTGRLHTREAQEVDLLALKMTVEQIAPREAAAEGGIHVRAIHATLHQAVADGYLLSPGSRIQRTLLSSLEAPDTPDAFLTADTFTLQWHITQKCGLHCRHCYDRSDREPMPFETALAVLDDLYDFCRKMLVNGHVSFTGGDPLLYPHFFDVYRAAADRGFGLAILGNPSPIDRIEKLIDIEKPDFFQISLEGLAEHNDYIRGNGHFERSIDFLGQLKALDIYTMVMLTLTRDNLEQVLPLAEMLRDHTDFFTFNRLAAVGEGARLSMPSKKEFQGFLEKYLAAADRNPILGLKDNLFNLIDGERDLAPFGGCTGYGCGAAFNFVSLLSDGEVHACRKFPSLIGRMPEASLMQVYHSKVARDFRNGSSSCRDCHLAPICRGCLASTYSHGLNVFEDQDPYCFKQPEIS